MRTFKCQVSKSAHHKMFGIPESAREAAALVSQHPRAVLHLSGALSGARAALRGSRVGGHGAATTLRASWRGRRRWRRGAIAAEARAGPDSTTIRHVPGYWTRLLHDRFPR